jgi:hypothetical protein
MLTRILATLFLGTGLWLSACGDTPSDLITAVGAAQPCKLAADCSPQRPVCDVSSGRCTSCSSDADCSGDMRCENASGQCVECLGSADCAGQEFQFCNVDSHRCVECLVDGHCLMKSETCSLVLGSCAVKCSSRSECPRTDPYCDTGIGYCVECETDADCAGTSQPLCRGSLCTGP